MMPYEAYLARHFRAHGYIYHVCLRLHLGRLVMECSWLAVLIRLYVEDFIILIPSQIILHLMLKRLTQQECEVVLLVYVVMKPNQAGLDSFDLVEVDETSCHRLTWVMEGPECAILDHPVVSRAFSSVVHLLDRALAVKSRTRDEDLGRQSNRQKIDQCCLTAAQWGDVVSETVDGNCQGREPVER